MLTSREARGRINSNMLAIARANYSMPPDHGAAIVRVILQDPDLKSVWSSELAEACGRIEAIRHRLAAYGDSTGVDFKPLANQNGMFSLLPLSLEQIRRLRDEHAVYMTEFGRVNLAGLGENDFDRLARALSDAVLG